MSNLIDELFPTPSLEERRANAQKRLTEIESGLASLSNQILEVLKRLPGGPYPPNQAWDFLHEQWKEIGWLADVAELPLVPPPAAVPTLCDYERELFRLREAAIQRAKSCDCPKPDREGSPLLDASESAVLKVLLESKRLLQNADIGSAADLAKQTTAGAVRRLIEKGLAHRPRGERKGVTFTEKGREIGQ